MACTRQQSSSCGRRQTEYVPAAQPVTLLDPLHSAIHALEHAARRLVVDYADINRPGVLRIGRIGEDLPSGETSVRGLKRIPAIVTAENPSAVSRQ